VELQLYHCLNKLDEVSCVYVVIKPIKVCIVRYKDRLASWPVLFLDKSANLLVTVLKNLRAKVLEEA
jgi:hypothetical protein